MGILKPLDCASKLILLENRRNHFNLTNVTLSDCPEDTSLVFVLGSAFAGDVKRYVVFVIMLLFSILAVLGNAAIIACVIKSPHLNSSNYSIYVISLAVSDVVLGAICMSFLAVYTLCGYWPLGSAICAVFLVCDFVCCSVSNLHLVVIAYDRFWAVADPLAYRAKLTRTRAMTLAAIAWLVSMMFYVPGVLVVRVRNGIQGTTIPMQCYYPSNLVFILGGVFLNTYGPSALLIILSIFVMVTVKRRTRSQSIGNTSTLKGNMQTTNTVGKNMAVNVEKEKITGQNRRCLVTLLAQTVLYVLCWAPWMVVFPTSQLCKTCVPPTIYELAYWMVYLNSTVNPVLYLVFNKDYRNAFLEMLSCSWE